MSENDIIISMKTKTLIAATFAALMFFAFEMAVPESSEAYAKLISGEIMFVRTLEETLQLQSKISGEMM